MKTYLLSFIVVIQNFRISAQLFIFPMLIENEALDSSVLLILKYRRTALILRRMCQGDCQMNFKFRHVFSCVVHTTVHIT